MSNPYFLWFMIGLIVGMLTGVYVGNKKLRRAVNGMIKRNDSEDEEYEDEE